MHLPGWATVAIAGVLGVGCFVLLAWVWAKALDERSRSPRPSRRRGVGRVQLVVLSLLLLIGSATATRGLPVQGDPLVLLQLRLAAAVALIGALLLFDRDLRRRADDPRDRHHVTGWGAAALGAVLVGALLSATEIAIATDDPVFVVVGPATVVALAAVAVLEFRVALAIQRRWERRRTAKRDADRSDG